MVQMNDGHACNDGEGNLNQSAAQEMQQAFTNPADGERFMAARNNTEFLGQTITIQVWRVRLST